jgi:hypothetical protein
MQSSDQKRFAGSAAQSLRTVLAAAADLPLPSRRFSAYVSQLTVLS